MHTPQVEFAENCSLTSVMPWALDRTVTADWGVPELAGVKAPAMDMLGQKRTGQYDIGAVETVTKPPRAADGQFTVASDTGIKSAGVFKKAGMLVAYLFHNLPLAKGRYSFWLPVRDFVGQPIPAGDHEVRVAESDFQWKDINYVADNGAEWADSAGASFNPHFVAFAPNGVLLMAQGPSEDHTDLRGYDSATGKLRWHMSGCSGAHGVAAGKDGMVYSMRGYGQGSRLTRLDSETGKVIPWPDSKVGHTYPATGGKIRSITVLGNRIYAADAAANKLVVLSTVNGQVEKSLDVPTPRYVAADEKTKVLWVVSGSKLVALDGDGKPVAESSAVPEPLALTTCNGQLVVASAATGKVHFFDANDPKNLKPGRVFGRGDGPFGGFALDRFWFQKSPVRTKVDHLEAGLALDTAGRFVVMDENRVMVFDAAGKNLWYTIGVFGNSSKPSYSTGNRRLWDTGGDLSFVMDEKQGSWVTEGLWDHSATGIHESNNQMDFLGDFSDGGKTFGVYAKRAGGAPQLPHLVVARLENFKAVPVLKVSVEGNQVVAREDTNGDGQITAADTVTPVVDAAGKSLPVAWLFLRFIDLEPDGSITTMANPPWLWKRTGLNSRGVPVYDGKNRVALSAANWAKDASPYDGKPGGVVDQWCGPIVYGGLADGGYVMQVILRNSGGTGLNNGAGTDLAGYAPDGRRRWVHQLKQHKGIAGMGTVDDITLTTVYYSCEKLVVDADGLGLGGFCEAPQLGYMGYWIDHPNLRLFKMPDGKLHATVGSNASGRHNWYRLDNQASLKRTKETFRVTDQRATELAALDGTRVEVVSRPPQPTIRIPRLKSPLPMDGDLEKWRKAGIEPVVVIGPSSGMNGPGDCSGVLRMAYEGQNLYFQLLRFDDVVTFHQRDAMYQQDAFELALNGTHPNGFQFIVWKDPEGKDLMWRHRFFSDLAPQKPAPDLAPRIVRVLDNAEAVTERAALEGLYGVDLSKAKVIVTEFVLPIDKPLYVNAETDIIPLKPGSQFWIGFFLDDNDHPYTDVQSLSTWPATFGMSNPKEEGAIAVCE